MKRRITLEEKRIAFRMSTELNVGDDLIRVYTGISQRTMRDMRKIYAETGDIVRRRSKLYGRPRTLDGLDVNFLEGCILRQPDLHLVELQVLLRDVCDVQATLPTISNSLKRRGYTRKQLTRPAAERDEDDRIDFKLLIGRYFRAEQLVFADESHFNRVTSQRTHGWSRNGTRARRRVFFARGKRYSILPALSLDGILHLEVLPRAYNGRDFMGFVEGVLDRMQPWPLRNSVLVMDNASIHKVPGIREMVEERGMRLLYLPAYSPDLNPIEEAFSSIKAWLRANRDYVQAEMDGPEGNPYALIWEAVYGAVTPEKAYGWYRHSEYLR